VIERVLPDGVAHAEVFGDVPEATLFPAEAEVVSRAVDKRRREFTTVRHCARQALGRLGLPPVPLLPGERGAPRWPDGVVGSMTHCVGYRAAAVARRTDLWTLGIDAEPHAALPEGVLPLVSLPSERDLLDRLTAAAPEVSWDRLLFCAKEAVYKAWFPLARRWLDFHEAAVDLAEDGTFAVRLLVDGPVVAGEPVVGFTGRWVVERGIAVAAVAMPVRR
jgi:4'-phosphopantetheinyl transferase EntD